MSAAKSIPLPTRIEETAAPSGKKRIPTLDGWRAIAILLVLFDHIQDALRAAPLRPWTATGLHGVTIFFVLSGYLITTKLIEAPIDLRGFYVRRFFRLMPAAWAYLGAVWIFGVLCHKVWVTPREIASCVFFYRNYLWFHASGAVGHFWSLSLEEQFYLLWPFLLCLGGVRRCRWLAISGVTALASYRTMHWAHYDYMWRSFRSEVRADAILVGCIMALLLHHATLRVTIQQWSKWWAFPALCGFLFSVYRCHVMPPVYESVCIAALIASTMFHADSAPCRWLSFAPLAYTGALSYSLYIWQGFFVQRGSLAPVMLCLIPLFAIGSYYMIEKPGIQFGRNVESWLNARFPKRQAKLDALAEPLALS